MTLPPDPFTRSEPNLIVTNNKLTVANEALKAERDQLLLAKEHLRLTAERQAREITELRRALTTCRDHLAQAISPLSRYLSIDRQQPDLLDPESEEDRS